MPLSAALAAWERRRTEREHGVDAQLLKKQRREVAREASVARLSVRKAANEWLASYEASVTPKTY
ncbi:MAG TPA: hypothetical protein VEZ89_05765 [Rubrivivax sp.]|nr:hypothetical protein [Rubrivivax sp.]